MSSKRSIDDGKEYVYVADMILHHYAGSPFAEKIRAIFGYKQMSWASVETSMIMPRPDLMPLSGG